MRVGGRRERRERGGFTLLELLVVLGIITLLISVLMPSLARARESSRTTYCGNNLRQLYLSMTHYAADYDNSLPDNSGDNCRPSRFDLVQKNVGTPWMPDPSWSKLYWLGYVPQGVIPVIDRTQLLVPDTASRIASIQSNPGRSTAQASIVKAFYCPTQENARYQVQPNVWSDSAANAGYQVAYHRGSITDAAKLGVPFVGVINRGSVTSEARVEYTFTGSKALLFDTISDWTGSATLPANVPIHNTRGLNVCYGDGHVEFVSTGPIPWVNETAYGSYQNYLYHRAIVSGKEVFQGIIASKLNK